MGRTSMLPWTRRTFLGALGVSLATLATQTFARRAHGLRGTGRPLRLALLGDSHLMPAERNTQCTAQLRAVLGRIAKYTPRIDAVLFTGNLAYMGEPAAVATGHALLADVSLPLIVAAGAHDWHRDNGASFVAQYGAPNALYGLGDRQFVLKLMGAHVASFADGADASARSRMQALATPDDPRPARFALSDEAISYAQKTLAALPEGSDIIVLSHTPLYDYFVPWNFTTQNARALSTPLGRMGRVVCVHGQTQHPVMHAAAALGDVHVGAPSTAWAWPYPQGRAPAHPHNTALGSGTGFAVLHLPARGAGAPRCDYHLDTTSDAPTLSLPHPHMRLS